MTTDTQIEAAAEATYNALREPHNAAWDELPERGLKQRRFLLVARAALEAAEVAAWSSDMEAAPKDGTEIVLVNSAGITSGVYWDKRDWKFDAYCFLEERYWRLFPTPPTEGGR